MRNLSSLLLQEPLTPQVEQGEGDEGDQQHHQVEPAHLVKNGQRYDQREHNQRDEESQAAAFVNTAARKRSKLPSGCTGLKRSKMHQTIRMRNWIICPRARNSCQIIPYINQ